MDNCCFNRPYDDQGDIKIRLETEAKLYIQKLIIEGELELIWSYILDYENSQNPFEERRYSINKWKYIATKDIEENEDILKKAEKLYLISLRRMDALHVACAIYAGCGYFITTDDGILRRAEQVKEIAIIDPINFIKELKDAD